MTLWPALSIPSIEIILSLVISICISAGIVIAIEEWHWLKKRGALTPAAKKEMLLSLSLMPPNIIASVVLAPLWSAIYLEAYRITPIHFETNLLTFLLALLAVDFTYYWEHRCAHRLPGLWRLYHAQHHSSPAYTVATAYRVSFLNQLFSPAFYLPAILVGFHPLLIFGSFLICFHYQAWLHTQMVGHLGFLDTLFNTPANHRIHHSTAIQHRDRNLGAILMIWDRLFRTYASPAPTLRYGIPGERAPHNWVEIYLKPWWRRKISTS